MVQCKIGRPFPEKVAASFSDLSGNSTIFGYNSSLVSSRGIC